MLSDGMAPMSHVNLKIIHNEDPRSASTVWPTHGVNVNYTRGVSSVIDPRKMSRPVIDYAISFLP